MANFTVRVELHGARPDDYEALHAKMEARGFKRTIAADSSGVVYKLPTAEYNFEGTATIHQVRDGAAAAATELGKKHSILVSEATLRSWVGLETV